MVKWINSGEMNKSQKKNNLLIVDDDASVCISLKEILKQRFIVLVANTAANALEIIKGNADGEISLIDIVISDICMSHMDGLDLLKRIKKKNPRVEVIMITGYPSPENTLNALRLGASDFIVKPFQTSDILDSIDRVMEKRQEFIKTEELVQDLRTSIQKNYKDTTEALIQAIDAKDNYTKEHCERVAGLMVDFAHELGLTLEQEELFYKIGRLHDIGKIGVREDILNKPGPLTPQEREEIENHSLLGYRIVQPVEFLGEGREILLYHQERYDGKGYPEGLKGDKIPLGARMMTIVDSYDAMITDRPYRKRLLTETALAELERCGGTQFDPKLVKVFVSMIRKKMNDNKPIRQIRIKQKRKTHS